MMGAPQRNVIPGHGARGIGYRAAWGPAGNPWDQSTGGSGQEAVAMPAAGRDDRGEGAPRPAEASRTYVDFTGETKRLCF